MNIVFSKVHIQLDNSNQTEYYEKLDHRSPVRIRRHSTRMNISENLPRPAMIKATTHDAFSSIFVMLRDNTPRFVPQDVSFDNAKKGYYTGCFRDGTPAHLASSSIQRLEAVGSVDFAAIKHQKAKANVGGIIPAAVVLHELAQSLLQRPSQSFTQLSLEVVASKITGERTTAVPGEVVCPDRCQVQNMEL